MLFLDDDRCHALGPVIGERLLGAFEPALHRARLRRRHRGRQVDQPARINRVPAHHLQRRRRVRLGHHDDAQVARLDRLAAEHVGDVELARMRLAGRGRRNAQRADRLVIGGARWHIDQLHLRIAERGQLAAEHAAGVDAQRAVDPVGVHLRRMAIDHLSGALVVRGPVVAHRQTECVDLAAGLAIHGERAHSTRGTALHLFLQPGMRDDELAAVEDIMADERVEPPAHLPGELARLLGQLRDRLGEAVRDLHLLA